jgi:hypothetical protein
VPNRIVRENILTSVAVCSLGWPEEVFYRRLLSIVDDYGRYEAFPQLIRSRCYPLQTDQVRVADISRWMAACQKAGLIAIYEAFGKQYLEVSKFGQQQRTQSKYPPPPSIDSKGERTQATARLVVFEGVDGGVSKPLAGKPSVEGFEAFYAAYPRKAKPKDARKAWDKLKPDADLQAKILAAIEAQRASPQWQKDGGQFIPYPATWLNAGEWANQVAIDAPSAHWSESRSGIESKGEELGLGRWDRAAFELGRGEHWPAYEARVFSAAGFSPRRAA